VEALPIMGPWTEPGTLTFLASPPALAGIFDHMMHGGTAGPSVTETGAYGDVQEQTWAFANTDPEVPLTMAISIPDLDPPRTWYQHGMHAQTVTIDAAAGAMILTTVDMLGLNHSRYGTTTALGVPAGTHPGPILIGQPRVARADDAVFVRVTAVGQEDPFLPVQFKVLVRPTGTIVAPGDPAWATAIVWNARYSEDRDGDQRGDYRELYDEVGADLGVTDENGTRHPVLIAWPGKIASHEADLAVDDIYAIQPSNAAQTLIPAYVDESAFTIFNVRAFYTLDGGDEQEITRESATVVWSHPLAVSTQDNTSFGTSADRTSDVVMNVTLPRLLSESVFQSLRDSGDLFSARFVIEGRQIGADATLPDTPINRELIEITMPVARVTDATLTMNQTGTIPEALTIQAGTGFTFKQRWLV
jgi:hypothetical protein